jgi:excisionase family DNA binding protein
MFEITGMTANEFFWWWVERNSGVTETLAKSDSELQTLVQKEADKRNNEVFDRVLRVLADGISTVDPIRTAEFNVPLSKTRRPVTTGGITVAEAADRLGCSASKVYRLFNNGELTGHCVGDKIVIDPTAVEEYKQRHANRGKVRQKPTEEPRVPHRKYRHLDL